MNPLQVIQMMKSGKNPQQVLMNMLQSQMGNTPMGANILNLIQQGRTDELERIARNLCKSAGKDYDQEMAQFKKNIGL